MRAKVTLDSPVTKTPRVMQLAGLMDVPIDQKLSRSWDVELPIEDTAWNVGLIAGASGSGKTTLARALWPDNFHEPAWTKRSLVDEFPEGMSTRTIVNMFTAVGLGSVPSWLLPYRLLSTGERFRADMARLLAETPEDQPVVVDEYSSVVDRHVAQVTSHTLQKAIRKTNRQIVAVSCHGDILDWLQPDWVVDAAAREFTWRSVQRHPPIQLEVYACGRELWTVFKDYHYLSASLHTTAKCFAAYCEGRPVAFSSYRHFPHPQVRDIQMAHRVVVLPDWQGLGIAKHLCEWQGQYLADRGYRYRFVTAHPGLVHYFVASPRWKATARARQLGTGKRVGPKRGGMTARALDPRSLGTRSFEYLPVSPPPSSQGSR